MKIVLFGPERRIGAWQNDKIIDLNRALGNYLRDQYGATNAQARADEKIPPRLERFITLGKAAIEDAERVIEHTTKQGVDAVVHDVKSVKLHAPWPERRIACVGGNYAAHLAGMWAGRPGVTGDLAQITQLAKEEGHGDFGKIPMRLQVLTTRFRIRNAPGASTTKVKLPSSSASAARISPQTKSMSTSGASPYSMIGVSVTADRAGLKADPSVII